MEEDAKDSVAVAEEDAEEEAEEEEERAAVLAMVPRLATTADSLAIFLAIAITLDWKVKTVRLLTVPGLSSAAASTVARLGISLRTAPSRLETKPATTAEEKVTLPVIAPTRELPNKLTETAILLKSRGYMLISFLCSVLLIT